MYNETKIKPKPERKSKKDVEDKFKTIVEMKATTGAEQKGAVERVKDAENRNLLNLLIN